MIGDMDAGIIDAYFVTRNIILEYIPDNDYNN